MGWLDAYFARAHLGSAYYQLGRYQEAVEAYKEAIRLKPNFADAHNGLGVVYNALDRHQEAIEAYKQAIKLKPDHASAHACLGFAYLKIGDKESALKEYEILKTLDTKLANMLLSLINK